MEKKVISNMRIARIQNGYSQKQLADELNVSQTYISALESLQTKPSEKLGEKLEGILEYNIDYLLSEYKTEEKGL